MAITSNVPMGLSKKNWKEEHDKGLHKQQYTWCPLCMNVSQDLNVNVSEKMKIGDKIC